MKAAYITQWCAEGKVADSISFGEVAAPAPPVKKNVVIEVKASAINVDDVALLQDSAGGGWFFHGRTPSVNKPLIGGMEYAGVVLAVGPDCERLKVGDRVCGIQDVAIQKNSGTWAEQTLAPEKDVVLIPESCDISFVDAASVGMGAFICGDIYKRAKLPANGGTVRCLVIGASGGLGLILLQLLSKHQGANVNVTAVCSGKNAEAVRRCGANEVIDYNIAPFQQQLAAAEKFDVVFDFVGGMVPEVGARHVIKRGGKFITACGPRSGVGDRTLTCCEWHGWCCGLLCRLLKSSCCCCCAKYQYEMGGGMPPMKTEDFQTVVVEKGIRASIGLEVPFTEADIRIALRRAASRHTGGKVVINMERSESV
jgi:NADPH:quinone reductase-like Zn-dependent oxidoreductase